ncbi:hypothetical protein PR048_018572 [Dryococelus australis]|uniref:Uncharacterized protein n=1 Tax=Dryococelus australis TaxID=614101 RepID=A0ABQ9HCU9_9NEOP|nr:hypothetical protein PR048_018572 [Dryococelus australis]
MACIKESSSIHLGGFRGEKKNPKSLDRKKVSRVLRNARCRLSSKAGFTTARHVRPSFARPSFARPTRESLEAGVSLLWVVPYFPGCRLSSKAGFTTARHVRPSFARTSFARPTRESLEAGVSLLWVVPYFTGCRLSSKAGFTTARHVRPSFARTSFARPTRESLEAGVSLLWVVPYFPGCRLSSKAGFTTALHIRPSFARPSYVHPSPSRAIYNQTSYVRHTRLKVLCKKSMYTEVEESWSGQESRRSHTVLIYEETDNKTEENQWRFSNRQAASGSAGNSTAGSPLPRFTGYSYPEVDGSKIPVSPPAPFNALHGGRGQLLLQRGGYCYEVLQRPQGSSRGTVFVRHGIDSRAARSRAPQGHPHPKYLNGLSEPAIQVSAIGLGGALSTDQTPVLFKLPASVEATETERLACVPHAKANRVEPPAGSLADFRMWESAVQCLWSAGFHGDLPFPPPLHFGTAPYSPQSA